jgi:hypothetical protein
MGAGNTNEDAAEDGPGDRERLSVNTNEDAVEEDE